MHRYVLLIYLFLAVFSINIPFFYHGAIFAFFLAACHCLFVNPKLLVLKKYEVNLIAIYIFGFAAIILTSIVHGSYDFSYIKTYLNCIISIICCIPIVRLFSYYYDDAKFNKICNGIVIVFLVQTIATLMIILNPELRSFAQYFQRQSEFAEVADLINGGIRSNFISGPLFFGLSTVYAISILLLVKSYYASSYRISGIKFYVSFLVLNIGLLIAGRAGLVYILALPLALANERFASVLKLLIKIILMIGCISMFFSEAFDNSLPFELISNYAFEYIHNYQATGTLETSSTNELASMYNISVDVQELIFGSGVYSESDGSYYLGTDVGYLRKLLFGGIPFLIISFVATLFLLMPLLQNKSKSIKFLGFSLLLVFVALEFKGEVMLNLVSFNTLVFLLASTANEDGYFYRNQILKKFLT